MLRSRSGSRLRLGQRANIDDQVPDFGIAGAAHILGQAGRAVQLTSSDGQAVAESRDGSLVVGAPARVVRKLTKPERARLKWWAQKYVDNTAYCLKHKINVGTPLPA